MKEHHVDCLVIGSGPGGQKAAIQAAKLGKKVMVIEQDEHIGGTSLNSGTIPSKSLREAILDLTNFYHKSFYAKPLETKDISINDLNYHLTKTLGLLREGLKKQFSKNHIDIIHGNASFVDENKIIISNKQGEFTDTVIADKIIIATGSQPRNPSNIPFDNNMILDSTRLLSIDHLPKTIIVMGAGIIGSEYASFFAALGTKVFLVDRGEHILPLLDREIGTHLQNYLSNLGLVFYGQKQFHQINIADKQVTVEFKDSTTLSADMFLYALGREANVVGLDIEKAQITLDEHGFIPINPLFQTARSHIYAVGDVIGQPALAATIMEQGRLAARHAFGEETHHFPKQFPIGIYTIPEISSCGYTEEQ
ncbi:MAG: FAD-dependent oxidoreductase, partial [Chlamydiales bacterium]|nr:FAD-dependent oxidoreductase [Chlamydiales bacterium]